MKPKSISILVCMIVLAPILGWGAYRLAPESAPVARGAAYAGSRGCIDCHGDPGHPAGSVSNEDCSDTNEVANHPDYEFSCNDVLAWFEAIQLRKRNNKRLQENNVNPLAEGERLARKYYCFQCHGELGQGGFNNAGSFKGYVPGYFGADFKLLTRDANPESVREWIMNGVDRDILNKPLSGQVADYFFSRQAINMPSYKNLEPGEIEMLTKYVIAINEYGPMTAAIIRKYAEQAEL
jgi:mono/diheme cytochrome c family protein